LRVCFKNLKPCPFSIEEKANTAFVFMPFEKELEKVYVKGMKETLEDLGWACNRSDEKFDAPEIVCTICKNTQEARLILADLTGKNANVFLEVGLAFGLEKYVVFLSQNPKDIPFDTRTFRTIIYDPQSISDLSGKLRALIKSIEVLERLPMKSIFESRCAKLKRIKEVPPKPFIELFIGSTSDAKEWLPTTQENLDLMRCIPNFFRNREVIGRRKHFEFKSRSPEIFARMYSDGFFHCVLPFWEVEEEVKNYHLYWLMFQVAEPLFFLARVMKVKEVETEQTLKFDLHGIGGLEVTPFSRRTPWLSIRTWSFSEDSDFLPYRKTFNPKEKWTSFFDLLCEIYKEICIDLGIIDMKDETISQNVKEIVRSMQSLATTYSGRGLERLSLEEIFGESNN
jgi:hypothetical protein